VLLFKRILNFSKAVVYRREKRKDQRSAAGHPFPFKTVLTVLGHDSEGRTVQQDSQGVDWAGRLANLSASGASIHLHSAATGARGDRCRFSFSRDDYLLSIPGTIAYFRAYPQYMLCGLKFNFNNFDTRKAYLQLLEPVIVGASLAPVDAKKVNQDSAGLHKLQFKGSTPALLTVWRQAPGGKLHSFDFRMNDYGVRWSEGMPEVEAYGMETLNSSGRKTAPPYLPLTTAQLKEVRWLFRLAVPNLSEAVPRDIRKFMASLFP
jgi:hypothetical protein